MIEGIALGLEVYRTYAVYTKRHKKQKKFIVAACSKGFCIKEKHDLGYLPIMQKAGDKYQRMLFRDMEDAQLYIDTVLKNVSN